jgi:uncharacterized membrane protein YgcG
MRGRLSDRGWLVLSTIALWALLLSAAAALPIRLDQPKDGEFVRDQADMINPADEAAVAQAAQRALSESDVPIIVVTIPSMAAAGGEGLRIETFATILFDQWGIGKPESGFNNGILLLVSRDDRKARIELGSDWRRAHDAQATRIMETRIIPRFKQGQFSRGIVEGVEALAEMARQNPGAGAGKGQGAGTVTSTLPPAPPATGGAAPTPPRVDNTPVEREERAGTATPVPAPAPTPAPSPRYSPPPSSSPPTHYRPRGPDVGVFGTAAGGICGSFACAGIVPFILIFAFISIIRSLGRGIGLGGGGYTPRYRRGGGLLTGMMLGSAMGGMGRRSSGIGGFGGSSGGGFRSGGSSFGGGGGFSGGSRSFGGGHSGGGGATGSW